MTPLAPTPLGTRLTLRVQPRASRNAIVGLHGQSIRIRLTAPPVDGAANEALVAFLAERLGVSAAVVELVRGHGSRDKFVEVTGLAPEEVARRLGL
ncbi:MAG TPA: DUF167 domain-containing protein [Gemmatimonadales bacterium]|nr:DUF167 domain-containing protein [Gemmatimonadales bacterium]